MVIVEAIDACLGPFGWACRVPFGLGVAAVLFVCYVVASDFLCALRHRKTRPMLRDA